MNFFVSRFTVRSFYKMLSGHGETTYPWKSVWRAKGLTKVAFFFWLVSLCKILTTDNLRKCGICKIDWCYLCKHDGKTINHLFLHCKEASFHWSEIFRGQFPPLPTSRCFSNAYP